jgi:hypothetical protein
MSAFRAWSTPGLRALVLSRSSLTWVVAVALAHGGPSGLSDLDLAPPHCLGRGTLASRGYVTPIDQLVNPRLARRCLSVQRRARDRHSAQPLILDRLGFRFSYTLCRHLAEGES